MYMLSTSVQLKGSETQRLVSTFHTEMAKTLQEQPDMLPSILIWALNKQEEMTSSHLVMFFFTLLKVHFHGKEYQPVQKKKNMKKFVIKNCQHKSRSFVKIYPRKQVFISAIADLSNSKKSQILVILENYLKTCFIEWVMNMTTFLIGWLKNLMCLIK